MSKEASAFFHKMVDDLVGGINTVAIGKIESFDATKAKADVRVLPGNDLIVAVPVAMPQTNDFVVRMPYSKGDVVVIVFAQRDIDNILLGGDNAETGRKLSIDDAIVVGGINLFNNSMPADNSADLAIAKKDMSSKIVLKANGDIAIETAGNVFVGGSTATEGVPLGDQLKTWLDGHTHTESGGGATTAPTTASPAPSAKVRVE